MAKSLVDEPEYKARIRNAIAEYTKKTQAKQKGPSRRNGKPEKEVEGECLALMRSWGWDVEIYEAKATYDPRQGRWRQQAMKVGTVDCMGVTGMGIAVAIEFKAPGKLSTLRYNQREFLVNRIQQYAFAAVVDSADLLKTYRNEWESLRKNGNIDLGRDYLLSVLPKQPLNRLKFSDTDEL